jgi:hypothetical protein
VYTIEEDLSVPPGVMPSSPMATVALTADNSATASSQQTEVASPPATEVPPQTQVPPMTPETTGTEQLSQTLSMSVLTMSLNTYS